jgi:hypothetical protein
MNGLKGIKVKESDQFCKLDLGLIIPWWEEFNLDFEK